MIAELAAHLKRLGALLEQAQAEGNFKQTQLAKLLASAADFQLTQPTNSVTLLAGLRAATVGDEHRHAQDLGAFQLPGCLKIQSCNDGKEDIARTASINTSQTASSFDRVLVTEFDDEFDASTTHIDVGHQSPGKPNTLEIATASRDTCRSSLFTRDASMTESTDGKGMKDKLEDLLREVSSVQRLDSVRLENNKVQSCARRLIAKPWFETTIATLILLNAIVMGLQADWKMRNSFQENVSYRIADAVFTVVFLMELILRMVGEGSIFWQCINPNFGWNIFDTGILFCCVVDELLALVSHDTGFMDISVLRLLRVLRLARILRVVRVMRFFRDLRVMIAGIMLSLKSLTWALVLLILWMYLFSVCILDSCILAAADAPLPSDNLQYYRDLPQTMYTLYTSVFGGLDWHLAAASLSEINGLLQLAYCMYIAFASLCVLNIVTGVFVENANKITMKADGEALLDELENRRQWLNEVQALFLRATGGEEYGMLDASQFEELVSDLRVQAIFRKLGVEVERSHARGLFSLLDFDGNGQVDCEEFTSGLDQMQGNARSIDLIRIRHHLKRLEDKLNKVSKYIIRQFREMRDEVDDTRLRKNEATVCRTHYG